MPKAKPPSLDGQGAEREREREIQYRASSIEKSRTGTHSNALLGIPPITPQCQLNCSTRILIVFFLVLDIDHLFGVRPLQSSVDKVAVGKTDVIVLVVAVGEPVPCEKLVCVNE